MPQFSFLHFLHLGIMEDDELQAIRARRLAQMQQQQGDPNQVF